MIRRYCCPRLGSFLAQRGWLLLASLLALVVGPAQGQVRVLFVGNSYTHSAYAPTLTYNAASITDENFGLPASHPRYEEPATGAGPWGGVAGIFKQLTTQAGLNYEVHLEAISNTALQYHYVNALDVIGQRRWDRVVLQELSTRPLPVARGGQPTAFDDYATRLEQAVHTANPAARVYLYQTWARADLTYPAGQPYSGTTIEAMTQDLHDAYYRLAATNTRFAAVAPVGDAWLRAIQTGVALRNPYSPTAGLLNLWGIDNQHPSRWGAYLSACVLFVQLTGFDVRTLGGTEQAAAALGIAPAAAIALQEVAFQQVTGSSVPLPVTLVSFAARRQAAGVALSWATASEKNNSHFEVQRSPEGTRFATVAVVPGRGTTTQPSSYAALDPLAPPGLLYYRLAQVDVGGLATFSPVAIVTGATTAPALFPNPAHELLVLTGPLATAYRVRNQLGQLLLQGALPNGSATLGVLNWSPGIYFIEFQTSDGWLARRFEKY